MREEDRGQLLSKVSGSTCTLQCMCGRTESILISLQIAVRPNLNIILI